MLSAQIAFFCFFFEILVGLDPYGHGPLTGALYFSSKKKKEANKYVSPAAAHRPDGLPL